MYGLYNPKKQQFIVKDTFKTSPSLTTVYLNYPLESKSLSELYLFDRIGEWNTDMFFPDNKQRFCYIYNNAVIADVDDLVPVELPEFK